MPVAFQFTSTSPLRSNPKQRLCVRRARIRASVGTEIETALSIKFKNENVQRVIESFRAVRSGECMERGKESKMHQRAHSFIDGLTAKPFHDIDEHPWAKHLEDNWVAIARELERVTKNKEALQKGTNIWAKPVVQEANAYGPDWRTLVLQDREWDAVNCSLFPVTSGVLRDETIGAPCVEAFFARQAPSTGIKLHTDDCNFILTLHLALDAPKGKSWIEVGGERRYWENGKCLVFDTSFYHQTMNECDKTNRTVLLIRFWHPELSAPERRALQFLFKAIEDPSIVRSTIEEHENAVRGIVDVKGNVSVRSKRAKSKRGAGFGK